jgi:hypothetical protein
MVGGWLPGYDESSPVGLRPGQVVASSRVWSSASIRSWVAIAATQGEDSAPLQCPYGWDGDAPSGARRPWKSTSPLLLSISSCSSTPSSAWWVQPVAVSSADVSLLRSISISTYLKKWPKVCCSNICSNSFRNLLCIVWFRGEEKKITYGCKLSVFCKISYYTQRFYFLMEWI